MMATGYLSDVYDELQAIYDLPVGRVHVLNSTTKYKMISRSSANYDIQFTNILERFSTTINSLRMLKQDISEQRIYICTCDTVILIWDIDIFKFSIDICRQEINIKFPLSKLSTTQYRLCVSKNRYSIVHDPLSINYYIKLIQTYIDNYQSWALTYSIYLHLDTLLDGYRISIDYLYGYIVTQILLSYPKVLMMPKCL